MITQEIIQNFLPRKIQITPEVGLNLQGSRGEPFTSHSQVHIGYAGDENGKIILASDLSFKKLPMAVVGKAQGYLLEASNILVGHLVSDLADKMNAKVMIMPPLLKVEELIFKQHSPVYLLKMSFGDCYLKIIHHM
jgi:hypothetical protein